MNHYKLIDVVDEINEREKDPANSGYDCFVGLEHYVSGEVVIRDYGSTEKLESTMKVFKKGDILVARRNVYLKRASMVDFNGLTSGDSIVLRAKDPLIGKILPFVLNTDAFWDYADQYADGTMSKRLSPKTLMQYEFDLPDKDDLAELVDILWAADATKESYRRLIEETDELVKSQFIEMFDSYPKERFGDFCTTHARIGWQKLTRAEFLDEGDYYLVTGWDIMPDHTVAFEQCKYVTKERYEQDTKLILCKGDVLLTKDGTLGKVAIIGDMDKPATLNGHIFVIRPKDKRVIPEFLLGLFISDDFVNQLDSNKTGSTIKGITQKALLEFEIPVASVDMQKRFVEFMKQSDKSKFELKKAIENINELIRSLMQQDCSN